MKKCIFIFVVCLAVTVLADEALVDIKTWEVKCIKPDGSNWGTNTDHKVKSVVDPSIVWSAEKDRDPNEHISNPYATYTNIVRRGRFSKPRKKIVIKSEEKIDPNADDAIPLVKGGTFFNKFLSPGS